LQLKSDAEESHSFQSQQGERGFCTDDNFSLKFYINHQQVDGNEFLGYIGQEDDRVLISYGNETPEEIEEQLQELDFQAIRR